MNMLAIVFPGQGSQKLGMLSDLSKNCLLQQTFTEASDILGYDLWKLTQYGPVEELNKTYRAQPAILASSVAIWRILKSNYDVIPQFMAGHSLGEYTALVCSSAIDFSTAIELVELRGNFMQDAVPPDVGAMSVVVGLDASIIDSVCKDITCDDEIVALSAFNGPKHIVISGHKKSVENVNVICRKLGAKFVCTLPISVPSHCTLMLPAAKKLRCALNKTKILIPTISMVNNVDVCIEDNIDTIKDALVRQIYMPVRWGEIIEYFVKCSVNALMEIGPGSVLSNITKHIVSDNLYSVSINDLQSLNLGIKYLTLR